jgi:hypothetical protein
VQLDPGGKEIARTDAVACKNKQTDPKVARPDLGCETRTEKRHLPQIRRAHKPSRKNRESSCAARSSSSAQAEPGPGGVQTRKPRIAAEKNLFFTVYQKQRQRIRTWPQICTNWRYRSQSRDKTGARNPIARWVKTNRKTRLTRCTGGSRSKSEMNDEENRKRNNICQSSSWEPKPTLRLDLSKHKANMTQTNNIQKWFFY